MLARPIGPGARFVRWCRLNPAVASLAAVLVLALVGGISGIARQWRQTELERRNAVASDLEAQQLLSELVASNPVVPGIGYRVAVPRVEPLLKAAAHCKNHLQKDPGNLQLRIALTKVYGCLGTLYFQRRQTAEIKASFQNARNLWEPLVNDEPANPIYRDWLATTYDWDRGYGSLTRDLESTEHANRLWEELAEEQPANLDFMQKVRETRRGMAGCFVNSLVRDAWLRPVQDTKLRLAKLVHDEPTNRVLRKRLALACMQLAEASRWEPSAGQPSSFWQEAHDHYRILAETRPDDILVNLLLAECSCRLIRGQSPDPNYREAVRMLEQAGQRLATLLKQNPNRDWVREALLEDYCELALCHWKVGRNAEAAKIVNDNMQPLIAGFSERQADAAYEFFLLARVDRLAAGGWTAGRRPGARPTGRGLHVQECRQLVAGPWNTGPARRARRQPLGHPQSAWRRDIGPRDGRACSKSLQRSFPCRRPKASASIWTSVARGSESGKPNGAWARAIALWKRSGNRLPPNN